MNTESKNIPNELKKLQDNRALILLVELMGFLHDIGKLSSELHKCHYKRYDGDVKFTEEREEENGRTHVNVPRRIIKLFNADFERLLNSKISENILEKVKNREIKVKGFQRHHRKWNSEGNPRNVEYWPQNWVEEIINLADKKDSSEDRGKAIAMQEEFVASVFGNEKKLKKEKFNEKREGVYNNLDALFSKTLIVDSQEKIKENVDWNNFHEKIVKAVGVFKEGVASTYRSSNDVTLFDHGFMTGTISKSIVSKCILNDRLISEFEPDRNTHHFEDPMDLNLLIVSFDSINFISQGENLLDVSGRKAIMNEVRKEIKNLLEVDYPLGNCIYKDENHLCFLVPPIKNDSFNYLKRYIQDNIFNDKTMGLVIPITNRSCDLKYYGVELTNLRKKGEKEARRKSIETPPNFTPKWIKTWNGIKNKDKCILCGKMPQWKGKESDYLCRFCWETRKKRGTDKEKNREGGTRWIDELADSNGKIALITGRFEPLKEWLSGKFLKYQKIRTKKDLEEHPFARRHFNNISEEEYNNIKDNAIAKFAKLLSETDPNTVQGERVFKNKVRELDKLNDKESTFIGAKSKVGEFYYRIGSDIGEEKILDAIETKPPSPARLYRTWRELQNFSRGQIEKSRNIVPKGKRLIFQIVHDLEEGKIYEAEIPDIGTIEVFFDGKEFFTIERIDKRNPSDVKQKDYLKSHVGISKINFKGKTIEIKNENEKKKYEIKKFRFVDFKQFREIISSPTSFMFLIPANSSFKLIESIKEDFKSKFTKSLGKISLNIGCIYSKKKTPTFSILDSGRRFIDIFDELEKEKTKISNMQNCNESKLISLKIGNKEIAWKIRNKLGNGEITDFYYPYFLLNGEKSVHINKIKEGDKIQVFTNHFDFQFLDSNTRRFDIVAGTRPHPIFKKKGPRPYYLEEIETIIEVWETLQNCNVDNTQLNNFESLLLGKIEDWQLELEELEENKEYKEFQELIKFSIKNILDIEDKKEDKESEESKEFKLIYSSVLSGMFFDVKELYHTILKEKLGDEKK